MRIARHAKPECGHKRLQDCPLTEDDWRVVYLAYLGFLQTCRLVAEDAHRREDVRRMMMT